ncbi:hypothetical protein [Nocardia macrotermitis]|uniref:Uncharacterized protein n=1 Tax=Nocardia macrotermitis TaxID=2585198 RepID=A0A7K0CWS0_9NOCA|nr:hypothetical protein [Nocardia macrotermitis]MQY17861.1 hypothetical protein [Nocardia macrotermitis]
MSYDHILLPSGVAATPAAADAYLTAQQGQPASEVAAQIAAEVNRRNAEMSEQDSFLSVAPIDALGGALHVPSPYDAIGHVRALLFELATPRDYAIYDPQLSWLIDPAGRVPVTVTHGGAGEFPYLTESLVHQWIPRLSEPGPYLIVEREPEVYVQTFREDENSYILEYRDGSPDKHFGANLTDPARVADLIWDWTNGDRSRLNTLSWDKIDL